MSRFAQIIATQESLDEMEVELDTNQGAQQASEAVIDVQQAATEVDGFDSGLDAAETAVDNIDEITDNLKGMESQGGITPFAEQTARVALESIMSSLGLQNEVPNLESFSDKNIVATLEEKSESLFSRVIAGVKAAFEAILSFIQGLLRNRAALVKYLMGLKAKLGDIKDDSEVNFDKESKYFSNPNEVVKAIETAAKCIDFAEGINFFLKEAEKAVAEKDTSISLDVGTKQDLKNSIPDQKFEWLDQYVRKEVVKVFGSEEGVVGTVIGGKELIAGKTSFGIEFKINEGSKSQAVAKPDLSDLSEIINKAISAANKLKNLEKIDGAIKVFLKNTVTSIQIEINKIANRSNTDDKASAVARNHNWAMRALKEARRVSRTFGTMMPTIAFKNIKAAGDYVKHYIG